MRSELSACLPQSSIELWFRPLHATAVSAGALHLSGPRHVCAWVERRYRSLIERAMRDARCDPIRFTLVPDDAIGAGSAAARQPAGAALNGAYTFDRFVIGAGNRIAHGAALAVAEAPAQAYNPLFLHGPPGLGKTHLLGAIAHYLGRHAPNLAVRYETAEHFTNEFLGSLHAGSVTVFKQHYRNLDVLLIDDVQFLEGKVRTADELFHTFNTLFDCGAQIVLSADRMPTELLALAERLRDRFEWGLLAELSQPDRATRTTVLRQLVAERDEQLGDDGAIEAIADRCAGNLRALEGVLTRVIAHSSLANEEFSPELVERALGQAPLQPPIDSPKSASMITELVARCLAIDPVELRSSNRKAAVSHARQIAMFLTRKHTNLSLPAIASAFNRRDHTTVIYALRRIEEKRVADPTLATLLTDLSLTLCSPLDRDRTD